MSIITHLNPNRRKHCPASGSPESVLEEASTLAQAGKYLQALDLYEWISDNYAHCSVMALSRAYELYQKLPQDRYSLYQSRHFNFGITPDDKVLDVGSGHLPFPLATHLAEYAPDDGSYGRAGHVFANPQNLQVTKCSVESMPFDQKEFDFVYCSHVLEHVQDPIRACNELMRVAKRGYLECPSRSKDLWLNTAKISNHVWAVELIHQRLLFTEYVSGETDGLRSNILMEMHCTPQTEREKAFAALVLIKSDRVNTMLLWEHSFEFDVRRQASMLESHMSYSNQALLLLT